MLELEELGWHPKVAEGWCRVTVRRTGARQVSLVSERLVGVVRSTSFARGNISTSPVILLQAGHANALLRHYVFSTARFGVNGGAELVRGLRRTTALRRAT